MGLMAPLPLWVPFTFALYLAGAGFFLWVLITTPLSNEERGTPHWRLALGWTLVVMTWPIWATIFVLAAISEPPQRPPPEF